MLKMPKRLKFLDFFWTDVRTTVINSVIRVHKIQTYTFSYAEFVREAFGQVYFNKRDPEHC